MGYTSNLIPFINKQDSSKDKGISTIKIKENGNHDVTGFDTAQVEVVTIDGKLYKRVPKYKTNDVNSLDDLVVGHTYSLNWSLSFSRETSSLEILSDVGYNVFQLISFSFNINVNQYKLDYHFHSAPCDYLCLQFGSGLLESQFAFNSDDDYDANECSYRFTCSQDTIINCSLVVTYINSFDDFPPEIITENIISAYQEYEYIPVE